MSHRDLSLWLIFYGKKHGGSDRMEITEYLPVDFRTQMEAETLCGAKIYYSVEEYYGVRYTSERMYLLDYERTMTQIPDTGRMYANDKILLGITDENVDMMESTDGNTVVFSDRGQLLCLIYTNWKMPCLWLL